MFIWRDYLARRHLVVSLDMFHDVCSYWLGYNIRWQATND
ncbi:hypothetical protein LSH36_344g04032, partial [Paralvinella palmiformis]